MFVSPTLMATLVTDPDKCDFTCFEMIQLGGSAVSDKLIDSIKVHIHYLLNLNVNI